MASSRVNNHWEKCVTLVRLMTKPDGTICIMTRTFDGHEHYLSMSQAEAEVVSRKLAERLRLSYSSTTIEG